MAYKFKIRPQRQEKSLEIWSVRSLVISQPCAAQAGSADRPQRPGPPAPTLPRVRLSLPSLHQSFILQTALRDAPFLNGSSLPRQPAASALLGAHARRPAPPGSQCACSQVPPPPPPPLAVWPDIPQPPSSHLLRAAGCARAYIMAPPLAYRQRPALVRLRRREARVLGAWSGVHGLSRLFLGRVVFEWRPFRCPPARLRDASRGCADPCGSLECAFCCPLSRKT